MDGVLWIEIACIAKDWDRFLRKISAIAGKERWGLGNQNQKEEGGWSFVLLQGCMIR
jgi:hypothetical protein